jgi:hypothetical protein
MFVTYTPEVGPDSEPVSQRFEWRPGRLRSSEQQRIEREYATLTGDRSATWEAFKGGVFMGSAAARRVLLWHLLNTANGGKMRLQDVDPLEDEIKVEMTKSELREMRKEAEATPGPDRDKLLAFLDREIETAPDDELGKAPSNESAPSTD